MKLLPLPHSLLPWILLLNIELESVFACCPMCVWCQLTYSHTLAHRHRLRPLTLMLGDRHRQCVGNLTPEQWTVTTAALALFKLRLAFLSFLFCLIFAYRRERDSAQPSSNLVRLFACQRRLSFPFPSSVLLCLNLNWLKLLLLMLLFQVKLLLVTFTLCLLQLH